MKDRTFRDHIAPIRRSTTHTPPPWKRSAVRLSFRIGDRKTAHVYGVTPHTVGRWRRTVRID